MFDAAFLEQCADPGVKFEIVERFVAAFGTENPLAISITSGNRIILPEPPKTVEEAVRLAQRFVGQAVVRAGVTQFPVGVGTFDPSEITVDMFDACQNLSMGTALFGKVYRIVSHARGDETSVVLRDTLEAWRSGQFEHAYVFAQPDPGPLQPDTEGSVAIETAPSPSEDGLEGPGLEVADPNAAGIRVNLPDILAHDEPF